MIATVRKHQVVANTAFVIGEQAIALTTLGEALHIHWHQRLECSSDTLAAQDHLPHVAHIKQTCILAGPEVLFHNAQGVLNWHLIASERNHLGPKFHVQIVKPRAFQIGHTASSIRTNGPFHDAPSVHCA